MQIWHGPEAQLLLAAQNQNICSELTLRAFPFVAHFELSIKLHQDAFLELLWYNHRLVSTQTHCFPGTDCTLEIKAQKCQIKIVLEVKQPKIMLQLWDRCMPVSNHNDLTEQIKLAGQKRMHTTGTCSNNPILLGFWWCFLQGLQGLTSISLQNCTGTPSRFAGAAEIIGFGSNLHKEDGTAHVHPYMWQ